MSACCSISWNGSPDRCPRCGAKGRSVSVLTMKSLVRDHAAISPEGRHWFCRTPECDTVYFGDSGVFRKPDVKVRVGIKEREDPVPLCYCFGYTRGDIERDIEALDTTQIPERIKAEVRAGFCACEVKNPSGRCCLGDIQRAIQDARALVTSGKEVS